MLPLPPRDLLRQRLPGEPELVFLTWRAFLLATFFLIPSASPSPFLFSGRALARRAQSHLRQALGGVTAAASAAFTASDGYRYGSLGCAESRCS